LIRVFLPLLAALVLCLAGGGAAPARVLANGPATEVVVTLGNPPLAGRTGPARKSAAAALDHEQARFLAALHTAVPSAVVRWRYRLVENGAAVVVPRTAIALLRSLPGVRSVDAGVSYPVAEMTPARAAKLRSWQTGLPNRGDGIKIGIIDDGIDQTHPYFSPMGYTMPPGFPKGQASFTTAKVIVARAFPPPGATWKYASRPFDPVDSGHATHVAGIAAGDAGTTASNGAKVSGVAPRAYLGNYKALTVPTDAGVGLDGNAAEIVAAIEAAVADGMDVINLSIGEPEVEPTRDIVALALDEAAAAGVVPVVAAGNDFEDFGRGSLSSPGTSAKAITVAAVTGAPTTAPVSLASFSGAGPTALSLRLKPDISAPGVDVLSSVPGGWESMSGTSMATPQVAGTAALLIERHPDWTVEELKAALIGSGADVADNGRIAAPTRGGGGFVDPVKADAPLVLASPASVSFKEVTVGSTAGASVQLDDLGGGAGVWDVSVQPIEGAASAPTVPASVSVPGPLALSVTAAASGEVSGYVRLTRGADVRRIPYWFLAASPALNRAASTTLTAPGTYRGDTRGHSSLVTRYRYPDVPANGAVTASLLGPEQVFRFTPLRPVANFGVVITRRGKGSTVEPRVVAAGDENRLTGYPALPVNLNPYLAAFDSAVLAAGAVRPAIGPSYDLVFDSATASGAGAFTFRFWVNDTRPPTAALDRASVALGLPLLVRVADQGSGVDPATIRVSIDGKARLVVVRAGVVRIPTDALRRGTHRLRLQVSDYQESRNMENVPPILPNTRVLSKTIAIR
jgi:subtilisin family serine protease